MSGGGRFDLDNARLPELLPYQRSFYENDHEAEIQALAIALFNEHIAPAMFDVNVLGNPHLGSIDLVRRSVNADGLALLSGEGEAAETRFLYRAWKGRNRAPVRRAGSRCHRRRRPRPRRLPPRCSTCASPPGCRSR